MASVKLSREKTSRSLLPFLPSSHTPVHRGCVAESGQSGRLHSSSDEPAPPCHSSDSDLRTLAGKSGPPLYD